MQIYQDREEWINDSRKKETRAFVDRSNFFLFWGPVTFSWFSCSCRNLCHSLATTEAISQTYKA